MARSISINKNQAAVQASLKHRGILNKVLMVLNEHKVSLCVECASIICSLLGLFAFEVVLGSIGFGLGVNVVARKKDRFGYIGILLGISTVTITIIRLIIGL